jgi:S-adenosylmethionine:tRNA ribosyltransferase-isomerase
MINPRQISISGYDYLLPESRIAEYPKEERDSSKLLIAHDHKISEDVFKNIASYLPSSSLIVFNDTRVVEARILFQKPTGARIEIFCLEPDTRYPDITTAFATTKSVYWKCLVGNASAWPAELILEKKISGKYSIHAKIISRQKDYFLIQLSWVPENLSFAEILQYAGVVPLPPYIKRKAEPSDAERYQTIYARLSGSVAAPTAGLHFTPQVIQDLSNKNITRNFVTLHVGAGTFKPVKTETTGEHDMHAEVIDINRSLIENILDKINDPIIAVGTTSMRTLESLYWIGVKLSTDKNIPQSGLQVKQWEPYDHPSEMAAASALTAILNWMELNHTDTLIAQTSLMIVPAYRFRIVTVLITNFHQPRSTLLLLVAAFIGEEWKSVYSYALENDFRFLSYGDSCLFFRQ